MHPSTIYYPYFVFPAFRYCSRSVTTPRSNLGLSLDCTYITEVSPPPLRVEGIPSSFSHSLMRYFLSLSRISYFFSPSLPSAVGQRFWNKEEEGIIVDPAFLIIWFDFNIPAGLLG
jgi:hypothetical protein